jgi:hypothetical protein
MGIKMTKLIISKEIIADYVVGVDENRFLASNPTCIGNI